MACILKHSEPGAGPGGIWCAFVRDVGHLPVEEAALRMRHHRKVAAVLRAESCYAERRAIGVDWVLGRGLALGVAESNGCEVGI